MKNATSHQLQWSVQSVTQYTTADKNEPVVYNHDFWAFTPVNPASVFNRQFDAHAGPIDHPSYGVRHNLFALHWAYLEGEVGVDSPAGWVAVVDGQSQYAMVERFPYEPHADYPERASVIFYIDGPRLQLNGKGMPQMTSASTEDTPYYMEAELNSPMVRLPPGGTYALDSEWFPTRSSPALVEVTDAGAVERPLDVRRVEGALHFTGSFGVFYPGHLAARLYDRRGVLLGTVSVGNAEPLEAVSIDQTLSAPETTSRVALHLLDDQGADRGPLGEASVTESGPKVK